MKNIIKKLSLGSSMFFGLCAPATISKPCEKFIIKPQNVNKDKQQINKLVTIN